MALSWQDYIDSMEGATLSGRQASAYICGAGEELVELRNKLDAIDSQEQKKAPATTDELSLVWYIINLFASVRRDGDTGVQHVYNLNEKYTKIKNM